MTNTYRDHLESALIGIRCAMHLAVDDIEYGDDLDRLNMIRDRLTGLLGDTPE